VKKEMENIKKRQSTTGPGASPGDAPALDQVRPLVTPLHMEQMRPLVKPLHWARRVPW